MNSARMKYYYTNLLLLGLFILGACSGSDVEVQDTKLIVQVQDRFGNEVPEGGEAYLFTSFEDFHWAVETNAKDYRKAIQFSDLLNGTVEFSSLNANETYYVLVVHEIDGIKVNNFFSQYQLKNLLRDKATTKVLITLSPYNVGSVIFWVDGGNAQNLGISVKFDDQPSRSLDSVRTVAPIDETDTDKSIGVIYETTEKVYTWKATGTNGCYWEGEVEFKKDTNDVRVIRLENCENGVINFWSKTGNVSNLAPITVSLQGESINVGELTKGIDNAPNSCEEDNVLSISRPLGTYVYTASDQEGKCFWEGTINLAESGCENVTNIELTACSNQN